MCFLLAVGGGSSVTVHINNKKINWSSSRSSLHIQHKKGRSTCCPPCLLLSAQRLQRWSRFPEMQRLCLSKELQTYSDLMNDSYTLLRYLSLLSGYTDREYKRTQGNQGSQPLLLSYKAEQLQTMIRRCWYIWKLDFKLWITDLLYKQHCPTTANRLAVSVKNNDNTDN